MRNRERARSWGRRLVQFDGPLSVAPPASTLLTGLISYWKLNEAGGTRFDSYGVNDLTDSGSTGSVLGMIGNGANFSGTTNLYHTPGGDFDVGASDFTFAFWVKMGSVLGFPGLVCQHADASNDESYILFFAQSPNDAFLFDTSSNGLTFDSAVVDTTTISNDVWYYVVAWVDQVGGTINIQVNGGVVNSSLFIGPVHSSGQPFRFGQLGSTGNYLTGAMDEVGFWKRVLTPTERTSLYNGGLGLTYPF